MIGLPSLSQLDQSSATRIWLATAPADMRCGFDRLADLARNVTSQDPLAGHLFVFRSRGGDRLRTIRTTSLTSPSAALGMGRPCS